MSTQETTAVHIASSEDVDALVERLPELKGEQVLISVAEECDALLTAAEYYRVLAAARGANATIGITTNDSLRRELARMIGWIVVDHPSSGSRGDTEDFESRGGDTIDLDVEATPFHTTADLATYRPLNGRPASMQPVREGEPINGSIMLDPAVAEKLRSRNGSSSVSGDREAIGSDDDGSDDEPPDAAGQRRRFRPNRRFFMLIGAIGAPLVVLLVVAGILVYMLPTADVTLVPVENSISADLVYGLETPGSSYSVHVAPVPVSHTTTFDKQIPTTGERFEPDGTAAGKAVMTNATLQSVTIPAGTQLPATNGKVYVTQQDLTIPAADPFGAGTFGSATVAITATAAGEDGNTNAGTVVGQLPNGIYFNNPEPVAGGTVKRIAVVSQADIDALKQAALDDLAARSQTEFEQALDKSLQMVPSSETTSDPVIEFSLKAGQDGAAISTHATQTITAQQFDPNKLNELAKEEAARQLASKAGPTEIILGDSVTIGDPVPLSDGISFTRHATARTRAVISEDEQNALEKQLVGKSQAEVEQIVSSMSDVKSYTLQIQPDWLPQRMPELVSHIKITIASGDGADEQP